MLLLRTILVLTFLTLVPATYIAYFLLRHKSLYFWRNVLLILDAGLWLWSSYTLFFGNALTAQHDYALGVMMTAVLCLSLPQLAFVLTHLITMPFQRFIRVKWRLLFGGVVAAYTLFTLVYGYFEGAKRLCVARYTYSSALLPSDFSGFRIVQLSDLHLGTFAHRPALPQQLVDAINAENADLVVFTGDLVNYTSDEIAPYQTLLSRIRAKHGVVAILGNHDYATYDNTLTPAEQAADALRTQQSIRQMGWKLLLNSHTKIASTNNPDQAIYIAGTENETERLKKADLYQTYAGIPDSAFVVMLTHGPKYWETIVQTYNPALTLSGHIHGYQYAPLGLDCLLDYLLGIPSSGAYSDTHGHTLYVSKGVGTSSIFPIRYEAWPEINVITLTIKRL